MKLVDVEVERSARFKGERELTPYVDRPPDSHWLELFYEECENADDLDWKSAGFAVCRAEDVERGRARFEEITERANERCADFLSTATPPEKARELIQLELISAASVNDGKYRVVITHY